jgi:uncharacterized protein (DUF1501 family)
MILRPNRRQLLTGAAATGAGLALPRVARAESISGVDRKFLFVQALGGWDMTRVFTPDLLGSEYVDTEPEAEASTVGGITFVDHPARPNTRAFFQARHSQLCIINGYYISSISHSAAIRLMLTGSTDGMEADWPSRLAAARGTDHIVPYLVVGGPNFSGAYGVHVGHAGSTGQLQGLARGDILARSDQAVLAPAGADSARVDAWLAEVAARKAAAAAGGNRDRYSSFGTALGRARELKSVADTIDLDRGESFADQCALAARALSMGLSRCVSVAHPLAESNVEWDSHTENDFYQTDLFESLFLELEGLAALLETTPGTVAPTLAEETIVVVLSEMGRTPLNNGANGKDHWPYGSALLWGPGVRGGQVVGAFDAAQYGIRVDLGTGAASESGSFIGNKVLGATLMVLGDVDPLAEGIADEPLLAIVE